MTKVYLHADDFGLNMASAERILECRYEGCLQNISIMPNGELEAIRLIEGTDIELRAHLNLVEGKCVSKKEDVNLLVDKEGFFRYSFTGILTRTILPGRKKFCRQIEIELENQIKTVQAAAGNRKIGFDSHQHTFMIRGVFLGFCRILKKLDIPPEDVRISRELFLPFLKNISLWHTYSPVNIIKNLLLNFLYFFIRKDVYASGIEKRLIIGIIFSGYMDEDRILKILPDYYKTAKKKGADIEILFHPGYLTENEIHSPLVRKSFMKFYMNEGRYVEGAVLKSKSFCREIEKIRNSKENIQKK